jgi:hypothetical protein
MKKRQEIDIDDRRGIKVFIKVLIEGENSIVNFSKIILLRVLGTAERI